MKKIKIIIILGLILILIVTSILILNLNKEVKETNLNTTIVEEEVKEVFNHTKEELRIQEKIKFENETNYEIVHQSLQWYHPELIEELNYSNMIYCINPNEEEEIYLTINKILKKERNIITIFNGTFEITRDQDRPIMEHDLCEWHIDNNPKNNQPYKYILDSTFIEFKIFDCEIQPLNDSLFQINATSESICYMFED